VSAGLVDTPRSLDKALLEDLGFRGFRSVSHLQRTRCLDVPVERGVYVVVRDTDLPPEFMTRSVGGWYRQKDPSVPVDELAASWVEGAQVLYLGRARGPGVRSLLQQRVKRYIRFGQGKAIAHWGGRFIWQLRDHVALELAWRVANADEDPARIEASLLDEFVLRYGRLPFANLRQEDGQ
jgi:hypothetical protein